MPLLLLHFLVIHVGDNFPRNGVSPRVEFSNGILGGEGGSAEFLKNSRKLVDNGESKEDLRGEIIRGFFFESMYGSVRISSDQVEK